MSEQVLSNSKPLEGASRLSIEWPRVLAIFDSCLGLAGLTLIWFARPASLSGDGSVRAASLRKLIESWEITEAKYSLVGPIFSAPLYYVGRLFGMPLWLMSQYNFILTLSSLGIAYLALPKYLGARATREFLLLLIFASMFGHHSRWFLGDPFTAIAVSVSLFLIAAKMNQGWGIALGAMGIANTPASAVGLLFSAAGDYVSKRRVSLFIALVFAAGLILLENKVRRGTFFSTGYEGDFAYTTLMPFSGQTGFSYPWVLGVFAILFSFGKGLLFFAPGLFLPPRELPEPIRHWHRQLVLYVVGLVVVYAGWWSWYGGRFWGPRFFLIAGVPACLALADFLRTAKTGLEKALAGVALSLSLWVGFTGTYFGERGTEICFANGYELEHLCWYVPEFSVLVRPFFQSWETTEWLGLILVAVTGIRLAVATESGIAGDCGDGQGCDGNDEPEPTRSSLSAS